MGATGSGKTSGSGRALAVAMLKAGYGGLILLVKDDRAFWESLCREAGRTSDLRFISPMEKWQYNFLDDELRRSSRGGGQTENIVQSLFASMETVKRNAGKDSGRTDGAFWRQASEQLLRNLVELASMSVGRIHVRDLYRIMVSTPNSLKEAGSDNWSRTSFCAECLNTAWTRVQPSKREDLMATGRYFLQELPAMSPDTRGSIKATFSVVADALQRGVLPRMFCEETNITPEATEQGKIIVVDMPVMQYGAVGMLAAGLWKYGFQRSIERRNLRRNPRPVFLWIDEAQFLITGYDHQFLSTCRSSRVATVLLTQNLPNLYAALGGRQSAESEVDSLCGNLCTRIFHANGDSVTNQWASEMVGRTRQFYVSANNSYQSGGWMPGWSQDMHTSAGVTEHLEFEVEPSTFTRLCSGGPANGRIVEAIVVKREPFADTGRIWRLATFRQKR
jgi:hypothetical protein